MYIIESYKGYDIWKETNTTTGKEIYVVLFDRKRHEYITLGQARSAIALEHTRKMIADKRNDNQR